MIHLLILLAPLILLAMRRLWGLWDVVRFGPTHEVHAPDDPYHEPLGGQRGLSDENR
jgi:hypothetical protein